MLINVRVILTNLRSYPPLVVSPVKSWNSSAVLDTTLMQPFHRSLELGLGPARHNEYRGRSGQEEENNWM
jgi:hypothetical protein